MLHTVSVQAKKIFCVLFCLLFIGGSTLSALALEADTFAAPGAVLLDAQTGTVLWEKDAHTRRPCASITKVMTLLLVMEALQSGKISYSDQVCCSAHAAGMGGSDIWLREGEVMSVDDLLKATVIMSANDAAVALAEHVAGSEEDFVRRMNEKAALLGMKDTEFKNCNGLDEEGHLTSAYDVALMSRALLQHEDIFRYTLTWMDYVRDGQTQLVNTNKLIRSYQGITGLKTGTTNAAGSCITATAKRGDLHLVAVVLGCGSTEERFSCAKALLDYGFANWCIATPTLPELCPLPVTHAMVSEVAVETADAPQFLVAKGKENAVTATLSLPESVPAPLQKGEKVGEIQFTLDGETLGKQDILCTADVPAMDIGTVFAYLWRVLFTK